MKLPALIFMLSITLASQAKSSIPDSLAAQQPAKSEAVAYGLALGSTVIPVLVGGAMIGVSPDGSAVTSIGKGFLITGLTLGLTLGPSLGEFYAGSYKQGILGTSGRILGIGLVYFGALLSFNNRDYNGQRDMGGGPGDAVAIFGAALATCSTIYSLIDTHFAVKRAKEKTRAAHVTHFDIFPTLAHDADGSERMGMMARLSF